MENLVQYYILPLTGVNYKSFGKLETTEWNLRDVKLNLFTKQLECEVYNVDVIPKSIWREHNFEKVKKNFKNILIFNIPKQIVKTLLLFKEGKYSRFPEPIKTYIKDNSGLHKDHRYLQALELSNKLREAIEKDLGVTISKKQELLSLPKEKWFLIEEEV